jgi:hypothetical protein
MSQDREFGARCPNHQVVLVSRQKLGAGKGTGICPISGCRFDYDEKNAEKTRKLKIMNIGGKSKMVDDGDWKIVGEESVW